MLPKLGWLQNQLSIQMGTEGIKKTHQKDYFNMSAFNLCPFHPRYYPNSVSDPTNPAYTGFKIPLNKIALCLAFDLLGVACPWESIFKCYLVTTLASLCIPVCFGDKSQLKSQPQEIFIRKLLLCILLCFQKSLHWRSCLSTQPGVAMPVSI